MNSNPKCSWVKGGRCTQRHYCSAVCPTDSYVGVWWHSPWEIIALGMIGGAIVVIMTAIAAACYYQRQQRLMYVMIHHLSCCPHIYQCFVVHYRSKPTTKKEK
jgi:hypothetical protein